MNKFNSFVYYYWCACNNPEKPHKNIGRIEFIQKTASLKLVIIPSVSIETFVATSQLEANNFLV